MTEGIEIHDSDYRPNPDRAIWIEGQLNEALLERLRPEILELTAKNREPITVFINSSGGYSGVWQRILNLLRRTTEDDARVARIITVAAPRASSAAAELLSAGDFAIAPPGCTLLYHGARYSLQEQLTGEWARFAGRTLPTIHEKTAALLAHLSRKRFLFIVSALRPTFVQHRRDAGDPNLTDLDCFRAILRGKLSPTVLKVLDLAVPLYDSYNVLLLRLRQKLRRGRTITRTHVRKLMLHTVFALELERNPTWEGDLGRISEDFCFLNSYFDFDALCAWIAAPAAPQMAGADVEEEHYMLFLRSLCRALQEGENYITPMDAVWLGLIDTVR